MLPLAIVTIVLLVLADLGDAFVTNRLGLEIGESIRIGYEPVSDFHVLVYGEAWLEHLIYMKQCEKTLTQACIRQLTQYIVTVML